MANYDFLLYNRLNTTSKCRLNPIDATVTDEINGIRHLQLVIPMDLANYHQQSSQVANFDIIRLIDVESGDYRSFRIYQYRTEKSPAQMIIDADDLILDLLHIPLVLEGRNDLDYTGSGDGKFIASDASVTTVLTDILSVTDFTVGTISSALDDDPQEYQFRNETCLSALQKIVDKYQSSYSNCGFRRNEDGTIDFVSDLAQNTDTFLINRKNLINISNDTNISEYANKVWAYGAKGNWQNVHTGIESTITAFTLS